MPRGCDFAIHVELNVLAEPTPRGKPPREGLRKFIVEFDAGGEVIRIKERRNKTKPMLGVYDSTYWKAGTHPRTGLAERIINTAYAKLRKEQAAIDATP